MRGRWLVHAELGPFHSNLDIQNMPCQDWRLGGCAPLHPPSNRLQITKWPHKGGARNGAKLGSMGIIHHARLINIIIIVRRKRINLITNQT